MMHIHFSYVPSRRISIHASINSHAGIARDCFIVRHDSGKHSAGKLHAAFGEPRGKWIISGNRYKEFEKMLTKDLCLIIAVVVCIGEFNIELPSTTT